MASIHNKHKKEANYTRYKNGQAEGHYESYFLRANHPQKPFAFWIRYTIFSPNGSPANAIGELWATYFDGESNDHISVKKEIPISECGFDNNGFNIKIGGSILESWKLKGSASLRDNLISWDLSFSGDSPPLFLLPLNLYKLKLPKAKSLVSLPLASFKGKIAINKKEIEIKNWIGSQNHNWGKKHTDHYAWGQVAGFDNAPASFLEIGTARLKFGPIWTPFMTVIVLRHNGREYSLNTIGQSLKAKGKFNYFTWNFKSQRNDIKITGSISSSINDFVGLTYYNPPGGSKHCLNSKIASCDLELSVMENNKIKTESLITKRRAAFEILTDDKNHGVKMHV